MAFLTTIWAAIVTISHKIWAGLKWLYAKTHGGIVWLAGGIVTVLLLKKTNAPKAPAVDLTSLKKQVNDTIEQTEKLHEDTDKTVKKVDEVVEQVKKRQAERKKNITLPSHPLTTIIALLLVALLLLNSPVMVQAATQTVQEGSGDAKPAEMEVTLQTAYLNQILITEAWKQKYLEAESDNDLLIAQIDLLKVQLELQKQNADSLIATIKTLQTTIEQLNAWTGQLYQTLSTLTKKGISVGAMIGMEDLKPKLDGFTVGFAF